MFIKNLLNSSVIFFTSKMSVLLTVILVGRFKDFVVNFRSISFIANHVFLASPLNFCSFSEKNFFFIPFKLFEIGFYKFFCLHFLGFHSLSFQFLKFYSSCCSKIQLKFVSTILCYFF